MGSGAGKWEESERGKREYGRECEISWEKQWDEEEG
jgi:hypothetical protein